MSDTGPKPSAAEAAEPSAESELADEQLDGVAGGTASVASNTLAAKPPKPVADQGNTMTAIALAESSGEPTVR